MVNGRRYAFHISFFEPPPPPPEPEFDDEDDFDSEPRFGAPRNVLGAAVPLRLILVKTEQLVVAVTDATAYPTGVELTLNVRFRKRPRGHDPFGFHARHGWPEGEAIPDALLRFGLEFADGTKVTNVARMWDPFAEPDAAAGLHSGSGGGSDTSWEQNLWLWPLPPPGPLAFVCEWPSQGIPETRVEIDAELVLAAAARAEVLWD